MASDLNSSIESHWFNQFSDRVYEITQQTSARLRGVVNFDQIKGENKYLDRVGSTEVQNLNSRSPEVLPSDLQWDRRLVTADRVGVAFFLDRRDAQRALTDPQSVYAKRAAQALERDLDRLIISALDAAVFTGKSGTTSVSAATDGMQSVTATSGYTYDTLLTVDQNFQSYEIGTGNTERKFVILSEQEHAQLMKEAELISRDFTSRAVVDEGSLKRVMDFDVIMFGSKMPIPMLNVTSSQRKTWACVQGAITVAMPSQWTTKWQERNDRWHTDQLLASGERGAVRMEGPKVQKVTTTAT